MGQFPARFHGVPVLTRSRTGLDGVARALSEPRRAGITNYLSPTGAEGDGRREDAGTTRERRLRRSCVERRIEFLTVF